MKFPSNNNVKDMEYQSTNSKEGNLKLQSNCSIQSTNGTVQSGYSEESLIMSNQIHENKDNKFTQNDKHLNSTCSIQSTDGTVQNSCTDQTTLNRQNQNLLKLAQTLSCVNSLTEAVAFNSYSMYCA